MKQNGKQVIEKAKRRQDKDEQPLRKRPNKRKQKQKQKKKSYDRKKGFKEMHISCDVIVSYRKDKKKGPHPEDRYMRRN